MRIVGRASYNAVSTLYSGYIRRGKWAEKETLADYLSHRVLSIGQYLATLQQTPSEKALLERTRIEYQNRGSKGDENAFPIRPRWDYRVYHPLGLGKREVEFYSKYGLIGPKKLPGLSSQTLDAIFSRYTGIPATLSPQEYREARVRQEWRNKDILELACHPAIVGKIASLLGNNIKVRFTGIHEVPPGVGSFSSLTEGKVAALCAHSDTNLAARLSKRGLEGPLVDLDSINVWVSITGTHSANAPLYLFPKTDHWPILTPLKYLNHAQRDEASLNQVLNLLATSGFGNEMVANHALCYGYLQTSRPREELLKIRRTETYTEPGEYLIFSSHLMHGSDTNWTSTPRLAISIRYSSALNGESEDNLKAVNSMFSVEEKRRLGLSEGDSRTPIIQVLGSECHEGSKAVDLNQLRAILSKE